MQDSTDIRFPDVPISDLRAIIGLGNPGARYEDTRHNIGFKVLDAFANRLGIGGEAFYKSFYYATAKCSGKEIILCKPWTYMNCSGEAVQDLLQKEAITPAQLLVVYDDVALPTGRIRLRRFGGSGGHNGMESIISTLESSDFARLRCGIGNPPADVILTDYVLSCFEDVEHSVVNAMIERAGAAITHILDFGLEKTMALYNADPETGPEQAPGEDHDFDNRL